MRLTRRPGPWLRLVAAAAVVTEAALASYGWQQVAGGWPGLVLTVAAGAVTGWVAGRWLDLTATTLRQRPRAVSAACRDNLHLGCTACGCKCHRLVVMYR